MRRLFTSLEFRTLFERLEEVGRSAKPALEVADLDLRETDPGEVGTLLSSDGPKAVRLDLDERRSAASRCHSAAVKPRTPALDPSPLAGALADPDVPKWTTTPRTSRRRWWPRAWSHGLATDTMLAAYLLDPAAASFEPGRSASSTSGRTWSAPSRGGRGPAVRLDVADDRRRVGGRGAACALLLTSGSARRLRRLLDEVELPLSSVLARMQANGVALDVEYLNGMDEGVRDEMATLTARIYELAGEEFNLNSPRSSGRSCTRSSAYHRASARRRGCPPTPASSRSSATPTRSSTRSCPGASSTS